MLLNNLITCKLFKKFNDGFWGLTIRQSYNNNNNNEYM